MRVCVKPGIDGVAALFANAAVERADALGTAIGAAHLLAELLLKVALLIGVFGDDKHPPWQPDGFVFAKAGALVLLDPAKQVAKTRANSRGVDRPLTTAESPLRKACLRAKGGALRRRFDWARCRAFQGSGGA